MTVYGFNFITCGPSDDTDSISMSQTGSEMYFGTEEDVTEYVTDCYRMMCKIMRNKQALKYAFLNDRPKDGVIAAILLNDGFIEWKLIKKELK